MSKSLSGQEIRKKLLLIEKRLPIKTGRTGGKAVDVANRISEQINIPPSSTSVGFHIHAFRWIRDNHPELLLTLKQKRALRSAAKVPHLTASKPHHKIQDQAALGVSFASLEQKTEFYRSWEWRTLRMKILNRFGSVCMCCGVRPGDLNEAGV